MTTTPGFQRWRHSAPKAETHIVFPDGCRDLLVLRPPCAPVRVLVTELDFLPRRAALDSGVEIEGFRLRPGATISPMALEAIAASPECVETILGDECQRRDSLDDVIMALSEPGATVLSASKRLGISVRTLQRSFLGRALPPPDFWRLLAADHGPLVAAFLHTLDRVGMTDGCDELILEALYRTPVERLADASTRAAELVGAYENLWARCRELNHFNSGAHDVTPEISDADRQIVGQLAELTCEAIGSKSLNWIL